MLESEKDTERFLVQLVTSIGGHCRKYTSPGNKNVPDRLCFLPNAVFFMVEVKSESDEPNGGQVREHGRMRNLGFDVYVVHTKQEVLDIPQIKEMY